MRKLKPKIRKRNKKILTSKISKKQNPTEITNGIKWYYQSENYINTPPDFKPIFEKIIYDFGKILKQKFPAVINKVPMIVVEDLMFNKYNQLDFAAGIYREDDNTIYINGNYIKEELKDKNFNFSNNIEEFVKTLFHELGHFIYSQYLSENSIEKFSDYIDDNLDLFNMDVLIYYSKFPHLESQYPIYYLIIDIIIRNIEEKIGRLVSERNITKTLKDFKKIKGNFFTFSKPVSSYSPLGNKFHVDSNTEEELFCEMFSYYMVTGLNEMHSANFTILQTILPELRN